MKFRNLTLASIAAAGIAFVTPASADITVQGVTFSSDSSGNTLTLTITNALDGPAPTDNWYNIHYLKAFEIKGVGNVTDATLVEATGGVLGWTADFDKGLNSGVGSGLGCTSGQNSQGVCFSRSTPLDLNSGNPLVFTINFQGNLNLDYPNLKVQFLTLDTDTRATGDLLSQTLIPEPEIYAMMALGLGLVGWAARRKKVSDTAI